MKLIKPSFTIIEQGPGIEGIYKQIELAGRTCYKSEDKITETSAKEFVDRMIKLGHGAMLEHGTVYLKVPIGKMFRDGAFRNFNEVFTDNLYYRMRSNEEIIYITTNYRYIIENHLESWLEFLCEPTEYHEKRYTVKFITDQGILREFTRHRVFSFAVESTRYCNYNKSKFGNEITYIIPEWCTNIDSNEIYPILDTISNIDTRTVQEREFLAVLQTCEIAYIQLLKHGWKPQQARNVLPLATKCDMVMTGFVSDWKHFFDLRNASSAHPQARELAEPLHKEFINQKYI